MNLHRDTDGYVMALTEDERCALVWALEAGRALLLRDPYLPVLAAEREVSPEQLDALADMLFMAGCPAPART
jgi:hypothetical protein